MFLVLNIVILGLLLSEHKLLSIAPSFFPFCHENNICLDDCICERHQNCSLLVMDDSTRTSMLFHHNQIRQQISLVEPPASSMTLLKYNMHLEQISMCWASKCINEYSTCFLTPKFSTTSQSVIQVVLSEGATPNLAFWIQELKNLAHEINLGDNRRFSHNFAQIMSDKVRSVGCAWSLSYTKALTFVCTYGPSGRHQEEAVYQIGPPCSLCPNHYVCDTVEPFPMLCKPISGKMKLQSSEEDGEEIDLENDNGVGVGDNNGKEDGEHKGEGEEKVETEGEVVGVGGGEKETSENPVKLRTPPQLPMHPAITPPLPPMFPPNLSPPTPTKKIGTEKMEYTSFSPLVEPTTEESMGKKTGETNEEDENRKERHREWTAIGIMVCLLVLAVISAIAAVCIYTHGFGCSRA